MSAQRSPGDAPVGPVPPRSVWLLPVDVLDEGAPGALATVRERTGARGVTLGVRYHGARDVLPHNPRRRVAHTPAGLYYQPSPSRRPLVGRSPWLGERDLLRETCEAAAATGMAASAWIVCLHSDDPAAAELHGQENAFGDRDLGTLCPSDPVVREDALACVEEVSSRGVTAVHLESLHFHGMVHGYHHERSLEPLPEDLVHLLGTCFCGSCLSRASQSGIDAGDLRSQVAKLAGRWLAEGGDRPGAPGELADQLGAYRDVREGTVRSLLAEATEVARRGGARTWCIDQSVAMSAYATGSLRPGYLERARAVSAVDLGRLGETGCGVELAGYLADPGALARELRRVRLAVGDGCDLAVILRPGPPDCEGAENLAAKLDAAREAGCVEVGVYAYGLTRLGTLARLGELS